MVGKTPHVVALPVSYMRSVLEKELRHFMLHSCLLQSSLWLLLWSRYGPQFYYFIENPLTRTIATRPLASPLLCSWTFHHLQDVNFMHPMTQKTFYNSNIALLAFFHKGPRSHHLSQYFTSEHWMNHSQADFLTLFQVLQHRYLCIF